MGKLTRCARMVSLLALACSCGNATGASSASEAGGPGSANGGSASGGSASGGSASGGSAPGSGGRSGESTKQCQTVDGKLSYGPIGEPKPLPLPLPLDECSECGTPAAYGFRTSAGFGFVWQARAKSSAPGPNLYSLTVGPDFEGGEAQALSQTVKFGVDVAVAPNGFVATTCLPESKPEWIQLNGALAVAGSAKLVAPNAPCKNTPSTPSIVWTGAGYLTAFTDARGLVVASLDETGALIGEQILSAGVAEAVLTRFSKNGDRVLVVFNEEQSGPGLYRVLDLHGTPLGAVQPVLTDHHLTHLAIAPSGDGWLLASDSWITNVSGVLLTEISRDGLVGRQNRRNGGYPMFLGLTPSAYDGFLLVSQTYSGGQYGEDEWRVTLLDRAGEAAYSEYKSRDKSKTWPLGTVTDPLRDLVIQERVLDGSTTPSVVVQEYGCLE